RVFTWDAERFPNPDRTLLRLAEQGVKAITIVDPGVKYQPPERVSQDVEPEMEPQEESYYVYDEGIENDYFLRQKDGSLYIGQVWPGESVFVDYSKSEARRWWGDKHKALVQHGVAGIWNDMNEPADFTARKGERWTEVVSHDGGERSTHDKNRNVFGLLMARATWEGLARLSPDRRPFVVTRAGYAGIQRWSTTWTGDNLSTWESLQLSLPMFLNLGLSGQPFIGCDVGGFLGNCNGELLVRWYQAATLVPFCRNHCGLEGYDQEPWRFGKDELDIIRRYLKLRYRLLPYLYTVMEEAHRTGMPMLRPLLMHDQTDPSLYNLDDEFLCGRDLLSAPVLRSGTVERRIYLPRGLWYEFWTGSRYVGEQTYVISAPLETLPLFVRGGAAIPLGPAMNWVGEKPVDPLGWRIYPDAEGHAEGELYEDDGVSPGGPYRRTRLTFHRRRIDIKVLHDGWSPGPRTWEFITPGYEGRVPDEGGDLNVEIDS
ncbi:MAG: glycoside hydrolase family 31 protein, partial [Candidatus Xenobia bacterium]